MKSLEPIIRKIFFYGAFVFLVIAAVEKALNLLSRKSFLAPYWAAGDLIEFAAIALIFVIAMQLHQIRLSLSSRSNGPVK